MAEVLAFASLILGIFAVSALLAARAREVRATARIEDLESQVAQIAAHLGIPAGALSARPAAPAPAGPSAEAVALFAAGKKIEAIKLFRTESGADLGDAKAGLEKAVLAADAGASEPASDAPAGPGGRLII
jgi:ribosomal protein L7/L12